MQKKPPDGRAGRKLLWQFVLSGISLFLGGAIYFFFRKSELPFFSKIGVTKVGWLMNARDYCLSIASAVPRWIIDSLPAGLFAFGYALLIMGIWSGSTSRVKYFWLALVPVVTLGFELLQYAGVIGGTFCMQDILVSLAGIVAGFFVGKLTS